MVSIGKRRVIVVDGSPDMASSTAQLLKLADFDVMDFNAAAEVLPAAVQFRPDAVLLDLSLGAGGSGLDVARQIRERPELQHVLLVAVTGWTRPQDRSRAADSGIDHFLLKPAEPDELVRLIRAIERRRTQTGDWPAEHERRGRKPS